MMEEKSRIVIPTEDLCLPGFDYSMALYFNPILFEDSEGTVQADKRLKILNTLKNISERYGLNVVILGMPK